ncbi:hypothetical protein TeGR_g8577 [Tetraparma gracilis]|uniref:acetyl-CoA C-acyltransferase n=1 Tax=Tetraparma gracilis TaxID=2962635 RepID=A0ABQ6N091_9STRA|nr:hypothetical protein TeGR_g8577 [Tetraparma gracilis]
MASPMASPMAQQVVVVSVSRTPLTRALRGASSAPYTASLISCVTADLLGRCALPAEADWAAVLDDVAVGNVMAGPGGGVAARIGVAAGIRQAAAGCSGDVAAPTLDPLKVPLKMVSRQCASGLQAAVDVACSIRAGLTSCGLALGVESMSYHPMEDFGKAPHVDEEHDGLPLANDGLPDEAYDDDPASNPEALHSSSNDAVMTPMGATSDFVAKEYGIKREEQDAFAAASHRKAAEAWEKGLFDYELCEAGSSPPPPAPTESRPYPDNGIRPSTTAASLKSLKPAFAAEGSTTAGNSSQLTDGCAGLLLMSRSLASSLSLPVLATFVSFAAAGVPPRLMGVGPVAAVPKALSLASLSVPDVDLWEVNEAFASQSLRCVSALGLPPEKVNVNGGAIALGHPLGCTGARQVVTLVSELGRRGGGVGVTTMCVGTGMGCAAVWKVERREEEGGASSKL